MTALLVRGSDVFAGTYSGGVTRLRRRDGQLTHSALGGGCINPDGLAIVGEELLAATMEGLFARPVADDGAPWQLRAGVAPGRDVTAIRLIDGALWVASRRGIGVSGGPSLSFGSAD